MWTILDTDVTYNFYKKDETLNEKSKNILTKPYVFKFRKYISSYTYKRRPQGRKPKEVMGSKVEVTVDICDYGTEVNNVS